VNSFQVGCRHIARAAWRQVCSMICIHKFN
jgi:hypothetical protein